MGFNECESNRYLKPFPSYLLMLVSILPIGTQIHQNMSRLCAEMKSMSEHTVRWRRWCVWWKVGMNYRQMRQREEQPTCHVSLGWGREADDDVRFHPSVGFWRGICHHGWAKAKNNSFNFVCDESRVTRQPLSFLSGMCRVACATQFVAGKLPRSSSRWSLLVLPVLLGWCVWQ